METLPFSPADASLKDVLRTKYIKRVTEWLLGRDEQSLLAQKAGSVWETALTVLFLARANEMFEACGEEGDLREEIKRKSVLVVDWLRDRKCEDQRGARQYHCWEKVTWDTAVVVRCLLTILKNYSNKFTDADRGEILGEMRVAIDWLHCRFREWETDVKYPFGPADTAQIVVTMLYVKSEFPKIYSDVTSEWYADRPEQDLATDIVKYLLHIKTEKSITVPVGSEKFEDVVTCWWDDYFSTAEVIEALALFHRFHEEDPALRRSKEIC